MNATPSIEFHGPSDVFVRGARAIHVAQNGPTTLLRIEVPTETGISYQPAVPATTSILPGELEGAMC